MESTVVKLVRDMGALLDQLQSEVEKFDQGNNAAGTRVRKGMMDIKRMAQEVREEVTAVKAAK